MALRAHQAIRYADNGLTITWIVNATNHRLAAALEAAGIPCIALPLEPSFELVRNPISFFRKIFRIRRILRRDRPSLVMLLQGWIVDGFDGMFACRLAGVPFCSYIPLAHSPAELTVRRWPWMRRAVLSMFFRCIARYITIDEQQAVRIRRWRPVAQIAVVENFVPSPVPSATQSPDARQRLNISPHTTILGVVGRISFWQKAQDWIIEALGNDPFLQDKSLVFFGEGPDGPRLAELIATSQWRDQIHLFGWCDNPEEIYSALDLLIIPSRAEGVPLVMIEALARKIPVVGSDRDGMKSWLPAEWRFPFGDAAAMKRAIESALKPVPEQWRYIRQHLVTATDEERFARQFSQALLGYCAPRS
jgi:glycosyltransferase involved in cell wall biosynthesis